VRGGDAVLQKGYSDGVDKEDKDSSLPQVKKISETTSQQKARHDGKCL
jgi:hypothetical protein